MATLIARNQSVTSIRAIIDFVEDAQFNTRSAIQLLTRGEYLDHQWEIFVANNNQLRVEAADQNAEQPHADLFAEIEPLYLEAKSMINSRYQELEQIAQACAPRQEPVQQNGALSGQYYMPQMLQAAPQQIVVKVQQPRTNVENTWGEFDGTLTKWRGFCDLFTDRVHNDNDIAPAYKFKLLRNSLKGSAAAALGDWEVTDDNYIEAWNRLKELYEQTYLTGSKLMHKLFALQKLEKASGVGLQKLSNIGNEVFRQMRALQFPVDAVDFMFIYILHDRLDIETSTKWNLERSDERPSLVNFLAFLDRQARALLGAQHNEKKSSSDIGKDNRKRTSIAEGAKFTPKRSKFDANKPTEQSKCISCGEAHSLYKCAKFLKLTLAKRKQFVKDKNLCINCLRAGHMCKDCPSKECFRCNTKHNSLLCHENPLNKVTAAAATKSRPSPPKRQSRRRKIVSQSDESETTMQE